MRLLGPIIIGLAWLAVTAAVLCLSADAPDVVPESVRSWLPEGAAAAAAVAWKVLAGLPLPVAAVVLLVGFMRRERRSAPAPAPAVPGIDLTRPSSGNRRQVLPKLPAPYIVHPATPLDRLVGRDAGRQALSAWASGSDSPIGCLIAPCGLGKTALAWAWLHEDILGQPMPDPAAATAAPLGKGAAGWDGVFWWSFTEPGAGFGAFLDEAVAYLSGGSVMAGDYLSSMVHKTQTLLDLLGQGKYLIVLDGIERELGAFASLTAEYQGDELEQDDRGAYCTCVSPHTGAFLRRLLVAKTRSRVVLTGRMLPKELVDPISNQPAVGCKYVGLDGLAVADSVALLSALGIDGARERLEALGEAYGGHPLALAVLAGVIAGGRPRAKLRGLRRYAVPREKTGEEHLHALDLAYRSLDRPARRLLGRLAVVRGRVASEMILAFEPQGRPDAAAAIVGDLAARRLAAWRQSTGHLEMHALVRHLGYAQCRDRTDVHAMLADRLADISPPVQIKRVDDLQPSIELFHHLVGARNYDGACDLLRRRVSKSVIERFADHQTHARLLRGLFPRGEAKPPGVTTPEDRLWVVESLVNAYSYSGQTRQASAVCEAALSSFGSRGDGYAQAVLLGLQAGLLTRLGHLEPAEGCLRSLVDVETRLGREAGEAVARSRLGLLLAHRGAFELADEALEAAYKIMDRIGAGDLKGSVFAYAAQRALLMGETQEALDAARRARAEVEKTARSAEPNEHDYVRSGAMLASALVAEAARGGPEAGKLLGEADPYLDDAMARCRRDNLIGFEPDLLITQSRLHHVAKRHGDAVRVAEEALLLADRCEYRLKQAEIHNLLARIALDQGERDEARQRAELAKRRAACDGTPYSYQPAIEEAQTIIVEATTSAAA